MARKSRNRIERDRLGSLIKIVDEEQRKRDHVKAQSSLREQIVLRDDTFVRTVWYLRAGDEFDVLGWMYRTPGEPWNIAYRFKYHSQGKKKVYRLITPPEPTEFELLEIEEKLNGLLEGAAKQTREGIAKELNVQITYERLDIQLVGREALDCIADQPWAQSQTRLDLLDESLLEEQTAARNKLWATTKLGADLMSVQKLSSLPEEHGSA